MATSNYYLMAHYKHFVGLVEVTPSDTVWLVKKKVAEMLNKVRTHPAVDLEGGVTEESFQLRPEEAHDIIMKDTDVLGDRHAYITKGVRVVLLDADQNACAIDLPPVGEPALLGAEEKEALRKRVAQQLLADYKAH